MDPVSILGVAANALQFVDFGLKILFRTKELHKQSATKENIDIEAIATHLRETLAQFNTYSLPTSSAAVTLQSRCVAIINELIQAVNDLKVSGQATRWKSFRKAIKAIRSKDKIDDWIRRLGALRDEYNLEVEVEIL